MKSMTLETLIVDVVKVDQPSLLEDSTRPKKAPS
jgi:hypothetical protein